MDNNNNNKINNLTITLIKIIFTDLKTNNNKLTLSNNNKTFSNNNNMTNKYNKNSNNNSNKKINHKMEILKLFHYKILNKI